ncbi:MAG: DUF1553 domain-containing protein, partial [Verrucomicrobiota bacterium]
WIEDTRAELKKARIKPIEFHAMEQSGEAASGAELAWRRDHFRVVDSDADVDTYVITAKPAVADITGLRVEVLADRELPKGGPGLAPHGNFVLSRIKISVVDELDLKPIRELSIESAKADFNQNKFTVKGALIDTEKTGWAIAGGQNKNHQADFSLKQTLNLKAGELLSVNLRQSYGGRHLIGKFRLMARTGRENQLGLADGIVKDLGMETIPPHRMEELWDHYIKNHRPKLQALKDEVRLLEGQSSMVVRVLKERSKPRSTYLFHRGDFLQPDREGGPIKPGVPAVLHDFNPENKTADRLDFANWLMADGNPLTARVRVNMIWRHLFGHGLNRIPDDWGVRTETVTHPELLNGLARHYRDNGWSRKALIKTIVMSSTYRQQSRG